jgi:hypothetical protein
MAEAAINPITGLESHTLEKGIADSSEVSFHFLRQLINQKIVAFEYEIGCAHGMIGKALTS